jgi:hypothetical protein
MTAKIFKAIKDDKPVRLAIDFDNAEALLDFVAFKLPMEDTAVYHQDGLDAKMSPTRTFILKRDGDRHESTKLVVQTVVQRSG